jgi:hypothetical protein
MRCAPYQRSPTEPEAFSARGEMAEWSKAHPC